MVLIRSNINLWGFEKRNLVFSSQPRQLFHSGTLEAVKMPQKWSTCEWACSVHLLHMHVAHTNTLLMNSQMVLSASPTAFSAGAWPSPWLKVWLIINTLCCNFCLFFILALCGLVLDLQACVWPNNLSRNILWVTEATYEMMAICTSVFTHVNASVFTFLMCVGSIKMCHN